MSSSASSDGSTSSMRSRNCCRYILSYLSRTAVPYASTSAALAMMAAVW